MAVKTYPVPLRHNTNTDFCYDVEGGILVLNQTGIHPTDRPTYLPSKINESIYLVDDVHAMLRADYEIYFSEHRWYLVFDDRRDAIWFKLCFG